MPEARSDTWNVVARIAFGRRDLIRATALAVTLAVVMTAAPHAHADPVLTSFDVPTVDADPHGVVVGTDGGIWFTERVAGKIGRLQAGSFDEFDLPDPTSAPTGITVGDDGALWFTLPGTNQIGRLTTGGDFTEHTLPAANSQPHAITAAPDGSIWYTLRGIHRIGYLDDTGTHDVMPGGSVQPTGITVGPDGAIWYTEQRTNRIGRIDRATLAVTRYALPAASSSPTAISTGADGAMWFTLRGSNEIGRITTDGTITTYPIPTGSSLPSSIAPGGPEWMWFSQTGVDQVARIALADGSIEEFPADAGSGPVGVVANGTGAWFTEGALNRLTHLSMDGGGDDTVAPTIDLWSPAPGAWTVRRSGGLVAGYACVDEGAAQPDVCEGTVGDEVVGSGAALPDEALGLHSLDVHAADGAGNGADASAPYLVFGSVAGSIAHREQRESGIVAVARPADGSRSARTRSVGGGDHASPSIAIQELHWVTPRARTYARASAPGVTTSRSCGTANARGRERVARSRSASPRKVGAARTPRSDRWSSNAGIAGGAGGGAADRLAADLLERTIHGHPQLPSVEAPFVSGVDRVHLELTEPPERVCGGDRIVPAQPGIDVDGVPREQRAARFVEQTRRSNGVPGRVQHREQPVAEVDRVSLVQQQRGLGAGSHPPRDIEPWGGHRIDDDLGDLDPVVRVHVRGSLREVLPS